MSKAILGQTLTSDSGGGSYAQSKTHNEVRHDLTISDCKALARTLRRDLITPLVHINFGLDARIPTMKFDCEESEDLTTVADMYGKLVNDLGMKISTAHIYKKFGIPKPELDEDTAPGKKQNTFGFGDKLVSNKSSTEPSQNLIDDIADFSVNESAALFGEAFEPLQRILNNAESLDGIKTLLENGEEASRLLAEMENGRMNALLQNSLLLSNLAGRLAEDG